MGQKWQTFHSMVHQQKTSNNSEIDRWSITWKEGEKCALWKGQGSFPPNGNHIGVQGRESRPALGPTLSLLPSEPVAVLPCNPLPSGFSTRHWLLYQTLTSLPGTALSADVLLSSETLTHVFKQPVFSCFKDKQTQRAIPFTQGSVIIDLV